jgi:hypothetical protein
MMISPACLALASGPVALSLPINRSMKKMSRNGCVFSVAVAGFPSGDQNS